MNTQIVLASVTENHRYNPSFNKQTKIQFTVLQLSERLCQLFCSDTIQIVTMLCCVTLLAAHHRHRFSLSHQVLPRRHGSATAAEGLLKALLSEARQSTLYHHDTEYYFHRVFVFLRTLKHVIKSPV